MDVSRRSVLVLGAAALVTGCSSAPQPRATASRSPSSPPTPSASPSSSTAVPAALPTARRWQPSSNDREPACKRAAVDHIEKAGTSAERTIEVIDAQYGGLLASSASVLVVTRSWRRVGGRVVTGGTTFDVRLTRQSAGWHVESVYPSTPGSPVAGLSPLARRVLGSDRIDLPPAARSDVLAGRVHASVLSALLGVAGAHRVGISVIRSGHPLHVFGTTRPSDHPVGRAFDTWSIDGHPVVDARTSRQLVTEYMHAVAAVGSYNVGGPYLLGSPPQWFSDDTHHDHVHAGFRQ